MKTLILSVITAILALGQEPIRGFPRSDWKAQHERESKTRALADAARIQGHVRRMSAEPHAAGSTASRAVAEYAHSQFREWGLDARIEEFEALLPYPTERRLEMVSPTRFQARLQEPPVSEDPDSSDSGQLPTYNAYSASGDVTGEVVYVNYGLPADYDELEKMGISVKGRIALARYGRSWRGTKPKVAQERGAIACLIYSDPRDDGYFQGDPYPLGPMRPAAGVQRGSVMDMPLYVGDPLSPGWASEKGSRRLARDEARTLMKIPVQPISYEDAQPLLANLTGPVVAEAWRGALPITYHAGPGPATVHLKLEFDWTTKPLFNVLATIPGAVYPDQWIIYGNHHDAWVNGASDPVSGAGALLETARLLSERLKQGWRPARTIKLALWDGEEFGLVGSTEWVEKHQQELRDKAVLYLNSDSNGKGLLSGGGSPTLEGFIRQVARDVADPASGKSVIETANARRRPVGIAGETEPGFRLGPLGAGSDYVAFLHHIGVASLNLGFGGEGGGGVYHSIYDSLHWYTRFSDGDGQFGKALAQVMFTTLVRMADAPLLPFEFGGLSRSVRGYLDDIRKVAGPNASKLDLHEVEAEAAAIDVSATLFEVAIAKAEPALTALPQTSLARLNERIFRCERALAAGPGLPGREWYRHQIAAPGLYTGYSAKTLPGIREALEAGRWTEANEQAHVVAEALRAFRSAVDQATSQVREVMTADARQ